MPFVKIGSIPVSYFFKGPWFVLNILFQLPALLYNLVNEYIALKKLIRIHSLSMVISDNRYGLRNPGIRSILITHQISPVLPLFMRFAEYPLYKILKTLIQKFDECWIPDYKGQDNLSGALSHRFSLPLNAKFIGPLSRFQLKNVSVVTENYDIAIILSGPRPQLDRLTRSILDKTKSLDKKTIIICGFSDTSRFVNHNKLVTVVSHLQPEQFRSVVENAGLIVSTAGYSGIMDLYTLGCSAILIPFEGQTEQEYLCTYLKNKEFFLSMEEDEIDMGNIDLYIERITYCKSQIASVKKRNLLHQESAEHHR